LTQGPVDVGFFLHASEEELLLGMTNAKTTHFTPHGWLMDADTASALRPASAAELRQSVEAAKRDGGYGFFIAILRDLEGDDVAHKCYVQD